ncbi:MAG: AAA family ATPase [Polyangiaceae bacterium]|nr:AAA family ATPase [Polyangiaceae bacterium]
MITLVEARGFRCLELVRQPLAPFQVLAGPSGRGKSALLDVIAFLGDLMARGPEAAVRERADGFADLTWRRKGAPVEIAIEAAIPEAVRARLASATFETLRYEVALALDDATGDLAFTEERVVLKANEVAAARQLEMFPRQAAAPAASLLSRGGGAGARTILHKIPGGNDNFYSETYQDPGKGWIVAYKLGKRRSALGTLPEDESKFPATLWFKRFLAGSVHRLAIDARRLRAPSLPGEPARLRPDGENLAWAVADLERRDPDALARWIHHVRAAAPDLEGVRTVERERDRRRALILRLRDGLEIPSQIASEGTLRLLALTLPAFVPDLDGVHLVEEPEGGSCPRAVRAIFHALSAVPPRAQILLATSSPVILGLAALESVLCFSRTEEGATRIIPGPDHPALKSWQADAGLGAIFAAGLLG